MNWRSGRWAWRILPGSITTLGFAALLKLGMLQPLENVAYGSLFRLRGERPWDDRVVVVAIDDASIHKIGRFPWPRRQYKPLLDRLTQADSSVITIDLVWSESSPDDALVADAILKAGRVVLAQAKDSNGLPLVPVPSLRSAAIETGHILNQKDGDGITRHVYLKIDQVPILSLSTLKAYALVQAAVPAPEPTQALWLNWPGSVQQLTQYSFADVVAGKVPDTALRDKIVLVGVTATGIDPLFTPFDRDSEASGVHLHAAVLNNLLHQDDLKPVTDPWSWLVLLLGGPGLSLLLSRWRADWQVVTWVVFCAGWSLGSLVLFHGNYWVPIALPLGLFTSTTVAVALADRLRMNALLQRQVRQLWQRYQPDLVLRPADTWSGGTPGATHSPMSQTINQPESACLQSIRQLTTLADQFGRSQSAQAAIARSLSIGLLAADWDGWVWFCNPVAAQWLQLKVGDRLEAHLTPDWLAQKDWQADLQTLRQQSQVAAREFKRGDRWFEIKLEPLRYRPTSAPESSEVAWDGVLLLLEDITTRKQVEAALEKQIQELRRLSQLKDDFLSTVSHELRAPMTNIKMAIELLKMTGGKEDFDYYIRTLENECGREISLINDLLDLQRLEAGAQIYEPVRIDLRDWLPPVIAPFHRRAQSQQQTLRIQLEPQLPELISDQPSLERILVELVNNACKYTPPQGEITIAAVWNPPHVEFVVRNSGSEIPATELPRIFEKFYRVPQSDPWKRGGTGLGLALVKKLVECLGGKIAVNSGSGCTTFTVQLPLAYQPSDSES